MMGHFHSCSFTFPKFPTRKATVVRSACIDTRRLQLSSIFCNTINAITVSTIEALYAIQHKQDSDNVDGVSKAHISQDFDNIRFSPNAFEILQPPLLTLK